MSGYLKGDPVFIIDFSRLSCSTTRLNICLGGGFSKGCHEELAAWGLSCFCWLRIGLVRTGLVLVDISFVLVRSGLVLVKYCQAWDEGLFSPRWAAILFSPRKSFLYFVPFSFGNRYTTFVAKSFAQKVCGHCARGERPQQVFIELAFLLRNMAIKYGANLSKSVRCSVNRKLV